jgi:hypothetical protein
MEIDIQVLHNGANTNNSKEPQTRRLIQAFNIPCGGAKEESETTDTTTTGTGGGQMGL